MSTALGHSTKTLPAGTWQLDAAHSRVGFAVDYLVGTFHGTLSPVAATLMADESGPATLTGSAQVSAIRVEEPRLLGHLQSPEFFDAERTPTLEFRSTDIDRSGSDVRIAGELTIRGVSRRVELEGTISGPKPDPYGRTLLGLRLATTIDRTQFGLNWNAPLPGGRQALANHVAVTADLYLTRS